MKKVVCILLVVTALFSFTGCGLISSSWFDDSDWTFVTKTPSATEAPIAEATETPTATEEPENREIPTFKKGDESKTYTISEVYANNVDSVVGITTSAVTTNVWGQKTTSSCSGTGIILSENGYILTNQHVIDSGTSFVVTLYNGTTYEATLVGEEEANDIAVLKVNATGLQAASFSDSDKIVVGEDVIVIGNPLGELTYTLTRGVVSALNRVINTTDTPINMFQVDAAVNQGNSGGPAFDAYGNVIGVVSAKYASESIEGIGFCIPINDALNIAEQLIEYGYVKGKAALGIGATAAYTRSRWGMTTLVSGAYISYIVEGGAADKAGLETGMLITSINSISITSYSDLQTALRSFKSGDKVTLKGCYSDTTEFEKQVTLGEYSPSMVPSNWNENNGEIM